MQDHVSAVALSARKNSYCYLAGYSVEFEQKCGISYISENTLLSWKFLREAIWTMRLLRPLKAFHLCLRLKVEFFVAGFSALIFILRRNPLQIKPCVLLSITSVFGAFLLLNKEQRYQKNNHRRYRKAINKQCLPSALRKVSVSRFSGGYSSNFYLGHQL